MASVFWVVTWDFWRDQGFDPWILPYLCHTSCQFLFGCESALCPVLKGCAKVELSVKNHLICPIYYHGSSQMLPFFLYKIALSKFAFFMERNDVASMKDVILVQLYKHKWHRDMSLHCTKHHIHVVYYSRATCDEIYLGRIIF